MDTRTRHMSLVESSTLHASAAFGFRQQSFVEEFPDLAPGLVMSTFRSSRLWGGMAWRRAFAGRADQSAAARRMVGQLLADTGRADDARWVTAELVSNALRHSFSGQERGFFVVEVLRGVESVRIVVYDLGGGPVPDFSRRPGTVPEAAEDGRGLAGVAELAARTGVAGDAVTGHAVWAELSLAEGVYEPATEPASDDVRGDRTEEPSDVLGLPPADKPSTCRQEEGVGLDPSAALRERS